MAVTKKELIRQIWGGLVITSFIALLSVLIDSLIMQMFPPVVAFVIGSLWVGLCICTADYCLSAQFNQPLLWPRVGRWIHFQFLKLLLNIIVWLLFRARKSKTAARAVFILLKLSRHIVR